MLPSGFRDNIQPLTYCLCINCYACHTLLISPLQNGSTALHQASFAGETEEVEKLLAEGVDINHHQDDVVRKKYNLLAISNSYSTGAWDLWQ